MKPGKDKWQEWDIGLWARMNKVLDHLKVSQHTTPFPVKPETAKTPASRSAKALTYKIKRM